MELNGPWLPERTVELPDGLCVDRNFIYHHIPSYTIIYHHIPSYTIWDIYDLHPHIYGFLPCVDRKLCCGDGDTTETVSGQQFTAIAFASECFSQSQPFGRYPTKVEPCRTSWHTMAYHGEVSEN